MALTAKACFFEVEYNGGDDSQKVKLADMTLACEYDTDCPCLMVPIGTDLIASVKADLSSNVVPNRFRLYLYM